MRNAICLTPEALELLCSHDWTGDLPALHTFVLALAGRSQHDPFDSVSVSAWLPQPASARRAPAEVTAAQIRAACIACRGNKRAVARQLGISQTTLYERIKRFGLQDIGWTSNRNPSKSD
jgi:transcriptional regulator of acetoin/glycerol metabolism